MESYRQHVANDFKAEVLETVKVIIGRLKGHDSELMLPIPMIEMGLNMFVHPMEATVMIEHGIEETYQYWDHVFAKDEDSIIADTRKEITTDPRLNTDYFTKVLDLTLSHRDSISTPEFEEYLWSQAHKMVRLCILYAHLKRHPQLNPEGVTKYTVRFCPNLSIKTQASKWGVDLTIKE